MDVVAGAMGLLHVGRVWGSPTHSRLVHGLARALSGRPTSWASPGPPGIVPGPSPSFPEKGHIPSVVGGLRGSVVGVAAANLVVTSRTAVTWRCAFPRQRYPSGAFLTASGSLPGSPPAGRLPVSRRAPSSLRGMHRGGFGSASGQRWSGLDGTGSSKGLPGAPARTRTGQVPQCATGR